MKASSKFEWDQHNISKCEKYGLTISEIEAFLVGNPSILIDLKHSKNEVRYIAFGAFNHRLLFVVYTMRGPLDERKARVISARFARDKEIGRLLSYEENKKS